MRSNIALNKKISSKVEIEYPDFETLPAKVKDKFENLPTKVNFFRMLGYSPGTFAEAMDLTNASFKNPAVADNHNELRVLLVAAHEGSTYQWQQHAADQIGNESQ